MIDKIVVADSMIEDQALISSEEFYSESNKIIECLDQLRGLVELQQDLGVEDDVIDETCDMFKTLENRYLQLTIGNV
jgi:hypothetical protein